MAANLMAGQNWPALAHEHQYRVTRLASAVGVDPRTLERWFQERLGLCPEAAMEKYRLVRALQLLQERKLSIKEISDDLGYSDTSTFCRAFKKWVAITPKNFQELFRP